jgi:hypothetical protein
MRRVEEFAVVSAICGTSQPISIWAPEIPTVLTRLDF